MLQNELHFIIEKFGKFFVLSKNKTNQKKKNPPKKKKTISHSCYICDNDIRHSVSENSESTNLKKILQSALSWRKYRNI